MTILTAQTFQFSIRHNPIYNFLPHKEIEEKHHSLRYQIADQIVDAAEFGKERRYADVETKPHRANQCKDDETEDVATFLTLVEHPDCT